MHEPTVVVDGLVSTVIPVRNRATMLVDAVDSVMRQTWQHFEIIISDDGSADDTVQVGRALQEAHPDRIRYIWSVNRGAGAAREAGRGLARGEFIQYLDSDDTLWPRKFEVQIATLRSDPAAGAAYGWIRLCKEGEEPCQTPHKWSGRQIRTLFPHLLVDRWWNTNAPLWRRSVCDRIGPWSDLRYSQDWEYDARAGALGIELAYCPEFVTDQRHHSTSRQTGHGGWLAPPDRVRFFGALLDCARRASVEPDAPEMRHFARWVFRHAREAAHGGHTEAAEALLELCVQADPRSFDTRAYRLASRIVGWEAISRWSERLRTLAGKRPGAHTRKQSWMQ